MAGKELELLCIGNALIDVFAQGEEGTDYGLTQSVQHIEIEKLKKILLRLPSYVMVTGGGAANVAKIAGYLGAKVAFTGAIAGDYGWDGDDSRDSDDGDSDLGRFFAGELRAAAVRLRLAEKPLPTGICLMLRTGDKTQIAASPSAAFKLAESDICEEDIKAARVVVVDGFILDRPGLVQHILALADKHETVAAIDLGSTAIAREHTAEIAAYAEKHPLILFMNEEEARVFYEGLNDNLHSSLRDSVRFLLETTPPCVRASVRENSGKIEMPRTGDPIIVVKLRERGAVCLAGGAVYTARTEAVTPLESTGAGDAFCAGFLTAWVRNKTIPECAALGNKAAGIVLNAIGSGITEQGEKSLAELLELATPP